MHIGDNVEVDDKLISDLDQAYMKGEPVTVDPTWLKDKLTDHIDTWMVIKDATDRFIVELERLTKAMS